MVTPHPWMAHEVPCHFELFDIFAAVFVALLFFCKNSIFCSLLQRMPHFVWTFSLLFCSKIIFWLFVNQKMDTKRSKIVIFRQLLLVFLKALTQITMSKNIVQFDHMVKHYHDSSQTLIQTIFACQTISPLCHNAYSCTCKHCMLLWVSFNSHQALKQASCLVKPILARTDATIGQMMTCLFEIC